LQGEKFRLHCRSRRLHDRDVTAQAVTGRRSL
jgi:hypothetical protein